MPATVSRRGSGGEPSHLPCSTQALLTLFTESNTPSLRSELASLHGDAADVESSSGSRNAAVHDGFGCRKISPELMLDLCRHGAIPRNVPSWLILAAVMCMRACSATIPRRASDRVWVPMALACSESAHQVREQAVCPGAAACSRFSALGHVRPAVKRVIWCWNKYTWQFSSYLRSR